jgi:hypothetical protein
VPDLTPPPTAPSAQGDDLDVVARRLDRAESAQEVLLWTQVRGEMLRQNDESEDRKHRRWLQKASLLTRVALSSVGVLAGGGLVLAGHDISGLFALGAGLFCIAPDFVRSFFDRVLPRTGGDNE